MDKVFFQVTETVEAERMFKIDFPVKRREALNSMATIRPIHDRIRYPK